jgi:putative sterol carrier protein
VAEQVDPNQLAEAIKGLSDDELAKQIDTMGLDTTLTAIFDGMAQAFDASKAAGTEAIIQYDIATDEGTKQWTVTIAGDTCTVSEGASDNPRITLQIGLVDFVRLIFNQAQGPQLFMSGKLKLQGDMMFAMQMQNFFARDF